MAADFNCFPSSPNWYLSRCCDISHENHLLCYAAKCNLIFVNINAGAAGDQDVFRYRQTINAHGDRVTGVSFLTTHAELHCVSSSDDGKCRVWNVETSNLVAEMDVAESVEEEKKIFKATTLHSSPLGKGEIIVCNERGSFFRWDFIEGHCKKYSPFFDQKKPNKTYLISAVACSPHSADLVAVGYFEGVILLFDLAGNGNVIQKLRGHDVEIQSLHWRQPIENESPLLASGAKDGNVRVWDTYKGMEEFCMKLPSSRKGEGDQRGGYQTWTTVAWVPGKKGELLSGGYHGEFLHWTLGEGGKSKCKPVNNRFVGHTRMVFNICVNEKVSENAEEKGGVPRYAITIGQDRNVVAWDLKNMEFRSSMVTFGGFVYALEVSPMDPTLLAIGSGDNCVRIWRQSPGNPTTAFWNGIRGMVTCLHWHPDREGYLAYGTTDGRVGSLDGNKPGKHPIISTAYHRKTVYVVKWGPRCVPTGESVEKDNGEKLLFSVGDGNVIQHNMSSRERMKAVNLNDIIGKANSTNGKFPERTAMSWNINYSLLALGNEDGAVEIFSHPHLKLMFRLCGHLKLINCLAWKSCPVDASGEGNGSTTNFAQGGVTLATGGADNKVCVFDLSESLTGDCEREVQNLYPRKVFGQHKGRITGLAWSPHEEFLLASASYDGSIQIWSLDPSETNPTVANFQGHLGRALSVAWDGSLPNVLHSGADDFYLCSWDKTKQIHSEPPLENQFERKYVENKKRHKELRRKEREESKETQKQTPPPSTDGLPLTKSSPPTSSSVDAIPNGMHESCNFSEGAGESLLADEEIADLLHSKEEELLLKSLTDQSPSSVKARSGSQNEVDNSFGRTSAVQLSNVKKPKIFRHTLGVFNNVPAEEQIESLMNLSLYQKFKREGSKKKGIVKSKEPKPVEELVDEYPDIGTFTTRNGMVRLIEKEKGIIATNEVDVVSAEHNFQLEFMQGNISRALDEAIVAKKLSDWMVSMTIMSSPYLRQKACIAYAEQLIHPLSDESPDPKKAAFYLLACNMVYEAVQVLEEFKLFRDAMCIAKTRLREDDPVFQRLYVNCARYQFKNGQCNHGAHCYVAAGEFQNAANELRKRKDEKVLRSAEYIGMIGKVEPVNGNLKHALDYVSNCLTSQNDWAEALAFCFSFDSLHEYVPNVLTHRALVIIAGESLGLSAKEIPSFPDLVSALQSHRFFEIDVDDASVNAVGALEQEGEEWLVTLCGQIQCLMPSHDLEQTRFLPLINESGSQAEFVLNVATNMAKSATLALQCQSLGKEKPADMELWDIVKPLCDNMVVCAKKGEYSLAFQMHQNFFPYGLEEFIPDLRLTSARQVNVEAKELFFKLAAIFDLYGNWWDSATKDGDVSEEAEEGEEMSLEDMQCWLDILLPIDPPTAELPPDYRHLHPSRSEAASVLLGYVLSDKNQTKENCDMLLKRIDCLSDKPKLENWALSRKAALETRFSLP